MAGDFLPVLSTLVPLAIIVAISPLSIVPAVLLVLHTARPKSTGLAFLVGWLTGLAAVAAGLRGATAGVRRTRSAHAGFGGLGARRDRCLPDRDRSNSIGKVPPGGAAALGLGLTIFNPKVLLISAAAGFAIGTAGLSTPVTWLSVASCTVIAGSTAILPIVAYLIAAERLDARLELAKKWIERHQAALTAAVLFLVGLVLVVTGLADL